MIALEQPATRHPVQPELSIIMSGVIRLQVPSSPETQALFALAIPSMKEHPDRLGYVAHEANSMAQKAIGMLQDYLSRSPGLTVTNPQLGLSYAVIDGKLSYVFQLCINTK